MAVILVNCVTLGMYRPCEDNADCDTFRCNVLALIDHCIFVYFGLEMVCAVFSPRDAIVRNNWEASVRGD